MATPQNRRNTRVGSPRSADYATGSLPENNTSKKSYTTLRYGNDHGSISFGHIHKQADVISDVLLQASDGRHHITLDKDGQRKGWTTVASPGHFQLQCGMDNTEADDTLFLNAVHGNIVIVASDGKIRFQGTDIEFVAVGEGGSKGNIRMKASENLELDAKKILLNSKSLCKIASPGNVELAANSCLKIYGSLIKGTTDAVALKDSKVGGRNFQVKQAEF